MCYELRQLVKSTCSEDQAKLVKQRIDSVYINKPNSAPLAWHLERESEDDPLSGEKQIRRLLTNT